VYTGKERSISKLGKLIWGDDQTGEKNGGQLRLSKSRAQKREMLQKDKKGWGRKNFLRESPKAGQLGVRRRDVGTGELTLGGGEIDA